MPIGKPSVSDPRSFDLRALQGAVSNIRQRLEALDAAAVALQASVSTVSASQVNTLIAQINALIAATGGAQQPNTVYAGPESGLARGPRFRRLVWSDIPLPSDLPTNSSVDGSELVAVERAGEMLYTTLSTILALVPLNRGLVFTSVDEFLTYDVRLCVVDATLGNVVITLPSGVLPSGDTVPITIRRTDSSSSSVSVVVPSGQTIDSDISFELLAGTGVTFLAAGEIGWVTA